MNVLPLKPAVFKSIDQTTHVVERILRTRIQIVQSIQSTKVDGANFDAHQLREGDNMKQLIEARISEQLGIEPQQNASLPLEAFEIG